MGKDPSPAGADAAPRQYLCETSKHIMRQFVQALEGRRAATYNTAITSFLYGTSDKEIGQPLPAQEQTKSDDCAASGSEDVNSPHVEESSQASQAEISERSDNHEPQRHNSPSNRRWHPSRAYFWLMITLSISRYFPCFSKRATSP